MHKRGALLDSTYSSQILEVKYEDLVADPPATVQRICAFLNEQFEPEMLDWTPLLDMVPERERHIHPKLSRPITSDRAGIWRNRLSAFECFAMEACLWRDLLQLDYQLRFSRRLLATSAGYDGLGSPSGRAPHKTRGYRSGTPEPVAQADLPLSSTATRLKARQTPGRQCKHHRDTREIRIAHLTCNR